MSGLNFKEALAALARAFPAYLFYAAALVFGGLVILLEFALFLVAVRLARVAAPLAVAFLSAAILLSGWLTLLAWRHLFLYRRQAAMLYLFSGAEPCRASAAVGKWFPSYSAWARSNRCLRQALHGLGKDENQEPAANAGLAGRLAAMVFAPAVLSLAFARGSEPAAIAEALALYWHNRQRMRSLETHWLWFSFAGFALLFLCLALANSLAFASVGAPIAIGMALAAVIAWASHQAFVAPLALAGVSTALLAETQGCEPDAALCEKIVPLLTP